MRIKRTDSRGLSPTSRNGACRESSGEPNLAWILLAHHRLGDPLVRRETVLVQTRPVREVREELLRGGNGGTALRLERDEPPTRLRDRLPEKAPRKPAQMFRVGQTGPDRVETAAHEVSHEGQMSDVGDADEESGL